MALLILTKLITSNGIIGWGECYASSVGPKAMEAVIRDVFERYFLNENQRTLRDSFDEFIPQGLPNVQI